MSSALGLYNTFYQNFYSGTETQPDCLQMFVKSEKGAESFRKHTAVPVVNYMGFMPIVSIFSGLARVVNAVKVIFAKLSDLKSITEDKNRSELWNAFKNLFRGVVEIVPLTGIVLLLLDVIRSDIQLHKIEKELEEKENIAGVVMNGRVIVTIDLQVVDNLIRKPLDHADLNNYRLAVFRHLCLETIKRSWKKNQNMGMNDIFLQLSKQ